jgi:hypothetical protein
MPRSDYIKQLEEENEALRKRLEIADLKAECYEFIMNNLKTTNRNVPAGSTIFFSSADSGSISLVMSVKMDNNSICMQKIVNDFIEDEKALEGHDKK